ncbi:hypothetical protein CC78DRAFT_89853 [Lojkania enalia]|uniref:Uncharacterized protein n=1 Tax=Lojkania enalia TaxID=147567 RepID=A0A9P4MYU3_9PLEO|nr:hypothetical protein CC78DRAFT_89853 [Didymosphaeria enalia]
MNEMKNCSHRACPELLLTKGSQSSKIPLTSQTSSAPHVKQNDSPRLLTVSALKTHNNSISTDAWARDEEKRIRMLQAAASALGFELPIHTLRREAHAPEDWVKEQCR